MTSLLAPLRDSDIRSACREKIEALEHWLRRLIEDTLSAKYGDYFTALDEKGGRVVKTEIAQKAIARKLSEPLRYPKTIDALLLEEAIDIVCNPRLYNDNFRVALAVIFPEGRDEARTFLKRISAPRNNLAHANGISLRQAEQIICYTNDVIDSLKSYYRQIGMEKIYNAPLILRVMDSFGNSFRRSEFSPTLDGGILKSFCNLPEMYLWPGDDLAIEIEVDPTFDPTLYSILWFSSKSWSNEPSIGSRVVIPISNHQVGQQFDVQCKITVNRDWHRMGMGADDYLHLAYKVLPPRI